MANGLDFERQVHALLKKMGLEAEITRASADGGIDIIAHSREHITGGKYVIQCKDWSKPVGEPPVRDLYGVVTAENANKGILMTTSTFTAPALKFAEGKPLEMIDGTMFNQLLTKYSVAGSEGGAISIVKDERIKELTEQLNRNPKNIFALKELADIYLLQSDYNKAVELYETLVPLKPPVETDRLKKAYVGGLLNYGVVLAKLKRHDDALKVFRENAVVNGLFCMNEALLTHYLGLCVVAISLYQSLQPVADALNFLDIEELIELAYLQTQLDEPCLYAMMHEDGQVKLVPLPLDTALQRAKLEGKQGMYTPLFMEAIDIVRDFGEYWTDLRTEIATGQLLSRLEDDTKYEAERIFALENRCVAVISDSKNVLNNATTNALQESYRENTSRQITLIEIIHDGISKFIDCLDNATVDWPWDELDNCESSLNNKILEYKSLSDDDRFVKEEKKIAAKWEDIINNEKADWREKLRRTLYSN